MLNRLPENPLLHSDCPEEVQAQKEAWQQNAIANFQALNVVLDQPFWKKKTSTTLFGNDPHTGNASIKLDRFYAKALFETLQDYVSHPGKIRLEYVNFTDRLLYITGDEMGRKALGDAIFDHLENLRDALLKNIVIGRLKQVTDEGYPWAFDAQKECYEVTMNAVSAEVISQTINYFSKRAEIGQSCACSESSDGHSFGKGNHAKAKITIPKDIAQSEAFLDLLETSAQEIDTRTKAELHRQTSLKNRVAVNHGGPLPPLRMR